MLAPHPGHFAKHYAHKSALSLPYRFVLFAELNRSHLPSVVLQRAKTSHAIVVPRQEFAEEWIEVNP